MTIEIGSLIIRGTFGARREAVGAENARLEAAMERLRAELQAELREIRRDAERRKREF